MRTRSRDDIAMCTSVVQVTREAHDCVTMAPHSESIIEISPPGTYVTGKSTIVDVASGLGKENPCVHTHWKFVPDGASLMAKATFQLLGLCWSDTYSGDSAAFYKYLGSPTPPSVALGFPQPKWAQMMRTLKSRGSVPKGSFFVLETIKDVLSVIHGVRAGRPKRALNSAKSIIKKFATGKTIVLGSLKDLLRKVSGGHLAYQFAVVPLISDVIAMGKISRSFEKQMRTVRKLQQTGRATTSIKDVISLTDSVPPGTSTTIYFLRKKSVRTITLSAPATLTSPDGTSVSSFFLQFFKLDRLAGTAWEFIPFSFVVDWFFHIDKKIEAFESQFLGSDALYAIKKTGFRVSTKVETFSEVFLRFTSIPPYYPVDGYPLHIKIGSTISTTYVRDAFDSQAAQGLFDLGSLPRAIAGSLLLSKLTRRKG